MEKFTLFSTFSLFDIQAVGAASFSRLGFFDVLSADIQTAEVRQVMLGPPMWIVLRIALYRSVAVKL